MFSNEILAKALYTFDPVGDGEIGLFEGEEIQIIDDNYGEGWCMIKKNNGRSGIAPKSYLETIEYPEPKVPPPPLPPAPNVLPNRNSFNNQWNAGKKQSNDNWALPSRNNNSVNSDAPVVKPRLPNTNQALLRRNNNNQDQNNYQQPPSVQQQFSSVQQRPHSVPQPQINQQHSYDFDDDDDWDDDDTISSPSVNDNSSQISVPVHNHNHNRDSRYGTVSKKFNKTNLKGGEAYLFGTIPDTSREVKLIITDTTDGPMWKEPDLQYTCQISSPTKESKMKGFKSYVAYKLTPSANFSGIQVSRRYKQFDWLHQRLAEKYPTCLVPPLPDKQIAGRYEEDFISERMRQLQLWVTRLCLHPVLSQSHVWHHFLQCTDAKRWKSGKRQAEKDEFQAINFFHTVQVPPHPLAPEEVDPILEKFMMFIKSMDDSIKHLINVGDASIKRHQISFKKDFIKIGQSFMALSKSFDHDQRPSSQCLSIAIDSTGKTYEDIGESFGIQPKYDIVPLLEGLTEYKGILSVFPDIMRVEEHARLTISCTFTSPNQPFWLLQYELSPKTTPSNSPSHSPRSSVTHHSYSGVKSKTESVAKNIKDRQSQPPVATTNSFQNMKQKLESSIKASEEDLEAARTRADVITYATLAELNHFHRYRVADFRLLMQTFLQEQIKFYEQIVRKLKDQLPHYN